MNTFTSAHIADGVIAESEPNRESAKNHEQSWFTLNQFPEPLIGEEFGGWIALHSFLTDFIIQNYKKSIVIVGLKTLKSA
jgi:hypothetical protein